jgi:hypothetical protein
MSEASVSLGERRHAMSGDCNDWTPRELLRAMGNIDADGIVVIYFKREGGGTITGMQRSKTTIMEAVAMIEMAKYDLLSPQS